jgi:hypothetical protein
MVDYCETITNEWNNGAIRKELNKEFNNIPKQLNTTIKDVKNTIFDITDVLDNSFKILIEGLNKAVDGINYVTTETTEIGKYVISIINKDLLMTIKFIIISILQSFFPNKTFTNLADISVVVIFFVSFMLVFNIFYFIYNFTIILPIMIMIIIYLYKKYIEQYML